jgi:hypothetical protein
MRRKLHEQLALYDHGFVVIFFEAQCGDWSSLRRTALTLLWWEEIVLKIKTEEKGTFWAIPVAWPQATGELRNASLGLAQLLKDNPNLAKKLQRAKPLPQLGVRRRAHLRDERQTEIFTRSDEC